MAIPPPLHTDPGLTLALAVIECSHAPMVLLDGDLTVLAASASFYQAFGLAAASTQGRSLGDLGQGEWAAPHLQSLLSATADGGAAVEAYEFDLVRPGHGSRRVVLGAKKLVYDNADRARLLLSAVDATEARIAEKLKDDMLREKAILLQELQHRVANSLQIIASVLLQNARSVTSEESRTHLRDAHQRVISVAAVQRQLAATQLGEVELKTYFTQLCESIGASMIRDPTQISLGVRVDDSRTGADVSVSLGLIVTELVINALKHAFPGHRDGSIMVGYGSRGQAWTLSVSDDGVGMPHDADSMTSGLGTSIVEALARQLKARIETSDEKPGARVSIIHD